MSPSRTTTLDSEFSPEEHKSSWISGGKFQYPIPVEGDSWEACYQLVHRYDKEMCDSWRDEVDKLLIFAGLFSAAVTAFTVESFKMLQTDPSDKLALILSQSFNQTSIASSQPTAVAIRVNIFWFLSLALSLSTVSVGVLSMQWLREYQRQENNTPPQESLGLRQMRFQGLTKWRIKDIMAALPLLLQAALFLFFCGILDWLWSTNSVVALAVTVPVSILFTFIIATTVLPAFQYVFTCSLSLRIPQCPYKSPQSWLFHRIFCGFCLFIYKVAEYLNVRIMFRFRARERYSILRKLFSASDWRQYDKRWRQQRDLRLSKLQLASLHGHTLVREDIAKGLAWITNSFSRDVPSIMRLYRCFRDLGNDEKEVMFLSCERASPLAMDFKNKLGGEGSPAIDDYLCLRTLDHLLSVVGYASTSTNNLLQHRVELYIRLLRSSIAIPDRPMIYCPFKYYSHFSANIQIQLLKIANLFLEQSNRESDFATAIVIFSQTMMHPTLRTSPNDSVFDSQTLSLEDHDNIDDDINGGSENLYNHSMHHVFGIALLRATKHFTRRPEIAKYQSVRVRLYSWFLRVVRSTSFNHTIFNLTIPAFRVLAPLVHSQTASSHSETEFPADPIFQSAWTLLLDGNITQLSNVIHSISTMETTD